MWRSDALYDIRCQVVWACVFEIVDVAQMLPHGWILHVALELCKQMRYGQYVARKQGAVDEGEDRVEIFDHPEGLGGFAKDFDDALGAYVLDVKALAPRAL